MRGLSITPTLNTMKNNMNIFSQLDVCEKQAILRAAYERVSSMIKCGVLDPLEWSHEEIDPCDADVSGPLLTMLQGARLHGWDYTSVTHD